MHARAGEARGGRAALVRDVTAAEKLGRRRHQRARTRMQRRPMPRPDARPPTMNMFMPSRLSFTPVSLNNRSLGDVWIGYSSSLGRNAPAAPPPAGSSMGSTSAHVVRNTNRVAYISDVGQAANFTGKRHGVRSETLVSR